MSDIKCIINDLADKYKAGLTDTNNDAVWLHDTCLRICNFISEYNGSSADDCLSCKVVTLNYKKFNDLMPYVAELSKAHKTLLKDGPAWHTVTAIEMNHYITVFNTLVDYIREACPYDMLVHMYEQQEGGKLDIECDRSVLLAFLCIRKFEHFKVQRQCRKGNKR